MVTAIQRGQAQIYNGGYVMTGGNKVLAKANQANAAAKKYKAVTNLNKLASTFGVDKVLDKKTNGLYSEGVNYAHSKGYGKRKRRIKH